MRTPTQGTVFFWIAAVTCGLLFFPYVFAMSHWSGGESVAGYMWQVLLGFGSLLAAALMIALSLVVVGLTIVKHRRRSEQDAP